MSTTITNSDPLRRATSPCWSGGAGLFGLIVSLLGGCLASCGHPAADESFDGGRGIVGRWRYDLELTKSELAKSSQQRALPIDTGVQELLRMVESEASHEYTLEFSENHRMSTWRPSANGVHVVSEGRWREQDGSYWMVMMKMSGVPPSMMGHAEESRFTHEGDHLVMAASDRVDPSFKVYLKRRK